MKTEKIRRFTVRRRRWCHLLLTDESADGAVRRRLEIRVHQPMVSGKENVAGT
jgi:hypothetical protein